MKIVLRSLIVVSAALLLPGCSSEMTRFEYPVMGMKSADDTGNYRSDDGSYDQRADRRYSSKQDYNYGQRADYQTKRRDYGAYDQKRDVYDTASTDKPYQKERYSDRVGRDEINRGQLPALQEKKYSQQNSYKENRVAGNLTYKPAVKTAGGRHVVAEGDTLYNISRRYNVSTDDIRRANDLASNDIQLGQHLIIPGLAKKTVSPQKIDTAGLGTDGYYEVKKGDTVYNISRRFGVSRQELSEANGIDDMTQVQLGQKLVIPGTGKKAPLRVASIDKKAGLKELTQKKAVADKPARKIKSVDRGASTKLASNNRFIWPASGKILSKFGRQKSGTINDGVNVALPHGTAIKAADEGVVAYAGNELKGYGNLILIRHSNNWVTAYAHNSKLLVKRGEKVKRGQEIAKSGKSGSVYQPQLHFELRKGSKPVNPLKYLAMK